MIFGSICSGMEAASLAWTPLGWRCAFVAEHDPHGPKKGLQPAQSLLAHRFPDVPNYGDVTKFKLWPDHAIDVLVGGTPCQSFSVAGLRKGLADPRGSLMLLYGAIAARYRPRWLVWENVPGVLSSNGGRDFGTFLGMLAELGYGFAYRVLDAQYFGVAQRRARVFVVGHLGDWRPPAAVLFEPESLRGDPPPRRETGQGIAGSLAASTGGSDENDAEQSRLVPEVAYALNAHGGAHGGAHGRIDAESETFVTHALRADGFDASEDGTGRGTPLVPVAFSCKDHGADAGDLAPTLRAMGHSESHANAGGQLAVAFAIQGAATRENPNSGPDGIGVRSDNCAFTLEARSEVQAVAFALRGREGGAMPEVEGDGSQAGALRSASGGSSRDLALEGSAKRLITQDAPYTRHWYKRSKYSWVRA